MPSSQTISHPVFEQPFGIICKGTDLISRGLLVIFQGILTVLQGEWWVFTGLVLEMGLYFATNYILLHYLLHYLLALQYLRNCLYLDNQGNSNQLPLYQCPDSNHSKSSNTGHQVMNIWAGFVSLL